MQGFYEYKLYGNNEELKKALEMVELLSTTNKDFKYLYGDCRGISEDYFSKKKRKVLTFSMEESGRINGIPFEFDEMMRELSRAFAHLEIWGTGYGLDDYGAQPEWTSPAGSNEFKEEYISYPILDDDILDGIIDEDCRAIVDENGNLVEDTIDIMCEVCDEYIEVKIDQKQMFTPTGEHCGYKARFVCDSCGAVHVAEL